jgi:hypothetical protein
VGQVVHAQGGCVTPAACLYLGLGLATQIQP